MIPGLDVYRDDASCIAVDPDRHVVPGSDRAREGDSADHRLEVRRDDRDERDRLPAGKGRGDRGWRADLPGDRRSNPNGEHRRGGNPFGARAPTLMVGVRRQLAHGGPFQGHRKRLAAYPAHRLQPCIGGPGRGVQFVFEVCAHGKFLCVGPLGFTGRRFERYLGGKFTVCCGNSRPGNGQWMTCGDRPLQPRRELCLGTLSVAWAPTESTSTPPVPWRPRGLRPCN